MTAARPAPAWLLSALLVVALPVTFVAPYLLPGTGTWWPAAGMLAAALLLAPPRARWILYAAAAALTTPLSAAVYDTSLVGGLLSSSAVLLPAFVAERGLRPGGAARRLGGPVREFGGARYHVVVLLAGMVCGAAAGLLSLLVSPTSVAAQWGLSTSLGGLTSMLLVLPLVAGSSGAPATGSRGELWGQRLLLVVVVLLLFLGGSQSGVVATAAFPLLGWAALRATRQETHLQVCGLGIAAYVATTFAAQLGSQPTPLGLPEALETVPLHLFLASVALFTVPLALAAERLSQARAEAVRNATTVQRLLDGAGNTLLVATDGDGRILHVNEGACQMLGYRADDLVGQWPTIFHRRAEVARHAVELGVDPDLASCVARQSELGERRDWEFLRSDGSTRMVSLGFNLVEGADAGLTMIVASGEDVTDRVRTQHALETALDREHESVLRLREVDDVKQELISNVSHELRTPITSIAGYAELLSDQSLGELTRQQHDALHRIERNAVRLQALVDDLLTMSRSEAGRLHLTRKPVDLVEVVRGAWELFEEQLRHRDLETSVVVPPDEMTVVGDAAALERVIVNLVSNAVKFTPDGGTVQVTLARTPDGSARLMVRDSGIGIGLEDQAKLFTRFFRSREATDQAIQGTGLGLSIVQALVAQHGGQVSVRSQPGSGTRVTVELPPG